MTKNILCYSLSLLFSFSLYGQISFEQAENLVELNQVFSPLNVGFADINGDYKDDLVRLDKGNIISVDYQADDGKPFFNQSIANLGGQTQWTLCIGDINNNGFNDVMASGAYDGAKIYSRSLNEKDFQMVYSSNADFFAQGSNFADMNNDGWLDMFICHDDGESKIWLNDGTGQMVLSNDFIDMTTTPSSDNSGNYGSEWIDFDSDGDLDLYIAKCRSGVIDPTDPRRVNALFRNDGNNNYEDVAAEFGLDVGDQSWTANFGDIDNDGDMDCFIINHDVVHGLYENIENDTFVNISMQAGINLEGFALQGFLRDLDNDGYLDIIVSGGDDHVFMNNGDNTFSVISDPFGQWDTHSLALGDANSDGFLDAYVNYGAGIVEIGVRSDALWLNKGNDNSFLKISLRGDNCNATGVGTRIELYGDWGVQVKEVRAGEGYGIVNSFSLNFGLGSASTADSMIIKWPSGLEDRYYEVTANQTLLALEGKCLNSFTKINPLGNVNLCDGESVDLEAPEGNTYLWSTGENTRTISVAEEGTYHVSVYDAAGCFSVSEPIRILREADETPSINYVGDERPCKGTNIILTASEADGYMWSSGESTQSIEVGEDGAFDVTVSGACKEWTSESIQVSFLDAIEPIVTNDTIFEEGQTATLIAEGFNISWYESEISEEPISFGNSFETPALTETTIYYTENEDQFEGISEKVGLESHQGGSLYSGDQFNGGLFFNVLEELTLKSVKVTTDTPGNRIIEIYNEDVELVYQDTFFIEVGESRLELNAFLFPGFDYLITTNQENNLLEFGYNAPRLIRDETNVNFPYSIDERINITNSSFGFIFYYYFYDWEIVGEEKFCTSERVSVTAVVDLPSNIEDVDGQLGIEMYPNPIDETLFIENKTSIQKYQLDLFNLYGKKVMSREMEGTIKGLDLSELPAGVYIILMELEEKTYKKKLIKI